MTLVKTKRKRRQTKKVGSVRMSLLNLSKRPDEQVWRAIRYACSGLKITRHPNIEVTVPHARWWRATYYPHGCTRPIPLVVAGATTDETKFPYKYEPKKGGGYLPDLWLDSTECLISMMAHEFRHMWQEERKGRKRGKAWGSRGLYSDRDADAYAKHVIREYRKSPERQSVYEAKVSEAVVKLLPPSLLMFIVSLN